ncbi:MAG TPA: hypothetical protein DDW31_00540 [candidate division Zixibacteria bacterium]|jgi:hypothetical protein|nr:hypothetical protein [candidate division Zixibacteria bacterium]
MPPIIKILIVVLVALLLYSAFMTAMPHIRFSRIKGKMEEAVGAAMADSDEVLARELAEVCLEQKVPLVGDFFYKVRDDQGKLFYYQPETDQEKKQYKDGAFAYFLENIKRTPGQEISISIDYQVETYFPFGVYVLKQRFAHTETSTLSR